MHLVAAEAIDVHNRLAALWHRPALAKTEMTTQAPMQILLGIGFGEVLPDNIGILASMQVGTTVKGKVLEGVLDPILMQRPVLEQLHELMPSYLALMKERGLDQDRVPLPSARIAWNDGPTIRQAQQTGLYVCTGFGFNDPEPGVTTPIAYIESVPASNAAAQPDGAEYVMPFRVLVEFAECIPKVLESIQRGGHQPLEAVPDFDFAQLKFKWDPLKRKVAMNRHYLADYLRSAGVTSLPEIQQLMDMLAQLYVLHIRKGRARLAPLESCLRSHGIGVNIHEPATITPARRLMDNHMDDVLLEARRKARDEPDAFWQWLDAEIAPIETAARQNGEGETFEARYREVLQLAKDAGLARIQ